MALCYLSRGGGGGGLGEGEGRSYRLLQTYALIRFPVKDRGTVVYAS